MKKISLLAMLLIMVVATNLQSQVRIGSDADPNPSTVLDLNVSDAANNGTKGLALPRVNGTISVADPVKGLFVYNTADDKVYYYNGAAWEAVGGTAYSGSTSILLDGGTSFQRAALTGDITAPANSNATTVEQIRGKAVSATAPSNGQVLAYNGSAWEPTTLRTIDISYEQPSVDATGCDGSILYIAAFDYTDGNISGDVAKDVTDAANTNDHGTLPNTITFTHNPNYFLCVYKNNHSTSSTWADAVNGCANATYGGQTDWYLPNRQELRVIYENLQIAAGLSYFALSKYGQMVSYTEAMASNTYWSSTEFNATAAWSVYFTNGSYNSSSKTPNFYVRCVRRI